MTPQERDPIERIAYRPAEAAKAIGVHRDTIYNLMASGQLRSMTVGRARLIRAADLKQFVGEQEVTSGRKAPATGVVEREATEQVAYVLMFGKRWRCVPRGTRVECDPHLVDQVRG